MPYNPDIHHRCSIRLKGYDYSQQGAYFVTICTYKRNCLFGEIVDGEIKLNTNGEIVRGCWLSIFRHFLNVELDEFVIMPNHLHGIIIIENSEVEGELSSTLVKAIAIPTVFTSKREDAFMGAKCLY
jgi:putative transposase